MWKSLIRSFSSSSRPAEFRIGNWTQDQRDQVPWFCETLLRFGCLIFLLILFSPAPSNSKETQVPVLRTGSFLSDAFSDSGTEAAVPELRIFAEFNQFQVISGSELTLQVRVFIPEGWHLYSIQSSDATDFVPTRLKASSSVHMLKDSLRENIPLLQWDAVIEKQVYLHQGQMLLEQDYLISPDASEGIQDLEGELIFQACNNNICVPLSRQPFTAALEIRP